MDSENMKRVGLYLDKDLVNRADDMVKQFHFKSRNEFFAEAVEYYRTVELDLPKTDGICFEEFLTEI